MLNERSINDNSNMQVIRQKWRTEPPIGQESPIETIRRLRIQNKKLLDLVAHLKEEQKNQAAEKNKVAQELIELKKIASIMQALQKLVTQ
jgi:hypothetical protein